MPVQQAQQIPLTKALELLRAKKKKWKGPAWRKFSTSRLDEPQVRSLLSTFNSKVEALAAWATLEAVFNFLLRNLIFWKNNPPGLGLPVAEWLEACRLDKNDENFFFEVLSRAQSAGLLIFKKDGTEVFISAPEIIDDADEYTKRLLRKIQANPSSEGKGKKETTRTRLARLEKQVTKLTETVAQLVNTLQNRASAPPAAPVREEKPSKEEKAQILQEFKEIFKLETDNWRKAVILLSFPPKDQIGPGYLANMRDLSQASAALARWREGKKTQKSPEEVRKIEEAKVYAEMVRQGFDFQQVPPEITDLVQKILRNGGSEHAQRT